MKYHYYKTAICPKLPNILVYYNHSTGLCALKEKNPVGRYMGYMTEEEAIAAINSGRKYIVNDNDFKYYELMNKRIEEHKLNNT